MRYSNRPPRAISDVNVTLSIAYQSPPSTSMFGSIAPGRNKRSQLYRHVVIQTKYHPVPACTLMSRPEPDERALCATQFSLSPWHRNL